MVPDSTGRRIGLFGGTFDPVHNGHLAVAEAAAAALALDLLIFMPAAIPPHKDSPSSLDHRLAMLRLAVADNPLYTVSDLEARRAGPSYTVVTLTELRRQFGREKDFFFIMGADAFAEISTWKEYDRLLDYASLVVAHRPAEAAMAELEEGVRRFFPQLAREGAEVWRHPSGNRLLFLHLPPVPVSSTEVRKLAAAGDSLAGMIPAAVIRYIHDHRLYRTAPSSGAPARQNR
ncbi:MAG: nicotinate-nucleotide adenylyltransferase [Thermodesulfobacteriota bacterium]